MSKDFFVLGHNVFESDYALFARIVETGSMSAAARTLLTSPAQVSKRLVRLEQRLGVRLVHRTTRKLTLTPAGERFHNDVLQILRSIEDAENRLSGVRNEPSGLLRVSAPTSFARLHIAPHLHRFLEQFPKVALEFHISDEKVDLYEGHADLAVRITSEIPANLQAHNLGINRRVLCASPAYLEGHGYPATIEAIRGHRLLAADGQLPWRLANDDGVHVIEGRSHVRTNSSEIVREMVLCGGGIAFRSLWDIHIELKAGNLIHLLPGWGAPASLCIYALHPKAPTVTASTTAFVQFLRQVIDPTRWNILGTPNGTHAA